MYGKVKVTSFPSPRLNSHSVNSFLRVLHTYKGFSYAQTYPKCLHQPCTPPPPLKDDLSPTYVGEEEIFLNEGFPREISSQQSILMSVLLLGSHSCC